MNGQGPRLYLCQTIDDHRWVRSPLSLLLFHFHMGHLWICMKTGKGRGIHQGVCQLHAMERDTQKCWMLLVSADVYMWMWSLFPFPCKQIRLKLRSNQYGMSTKQQSFHSTNPSLVNRSVEFPQPLVIKVVYFSFWIFSILKSHAVVFSSYLLWTIQQWWQQWL